MATNNATLKFYFHTGNHSNDPIHFAYKRLPLEGFPPLGMEWEVINLLMKVAKVRQTKGVDGTLITLELENRGPRGAKLTEEQVTMLAIEHWMIDDPISPNK